MNGAIFQTDLNLIKKNGVSHDKLVASELQTGNCIKAVTKKRIYYFVITNAKIRFSFIFYTKASCEIIHKKYYGERKIPKVFEVGKKIPHSNIKTPIVQELFLIK